MNLTSLLLSETAGAHILLPEASNCKGLAVEQGTKWVNLGLSVDFGMIPGRLH